VRRQLSALLLSLPACRGALDQSVLESAGPRARAVESLWWFALVVAAVVYVATVGALAWAVVGARRRVARGELGPPANEHRRMTLAVAGGTAATVAILFTFFFYDLSVGRTLRPPHERAHTLVQVTGHQWWWEVEYPHAVPSNAVSDANELHIPTGRPVLIEVTSRDVIHSLWIPNLGGKKDLIPRYTDTIWFQADRPGIYRSQCAEFCGLQHAKMALHVVAHEPGEYETWLQQARMPARAPTDTLAARGQEIFLSGSCALCHTIVGTPAGSRVGPDLTHLASRRTIAAGTLPNTRGNLAAWILDPQRIKPGANMPSNALSPADLEALLAYLQSLK